MDLFQKIGEGTGALIGGGLSSVVNLVAEVTDAQVLREAGQEIFDGNKQAGRTAGRAVDGLTEAAHGFLTKDDRQLADGKDKLTEVARTAVDSVKGTVDFAAEQVSEAYEGGKEMDGKRLMRVARNTGKALVVSAAVVSVMKVGKLAKVKL